MKILEVKNNLVKVTYSPQDNMVISGFVIIEDSNCAYVAQVMSLKADSGVNYAIVKLLFTFNDVGVVKNYNGTIPELNANVTSLAADELLDILPIEYPLIIGKLAQQNFILKIDFSALEKNLLICSDNAENSDILLSNTVRQIQGNNAKSLVFDTTGYIQSDSRLILGQDFKLPLNYETINFIYEHDLADVDAASKAVIQEILLEVQEYANTLIDKFIPFDSFISVIDSQYKKLQIPELALLKGRLVKYHEEGVFAQEAKDIQVVRASLRANLTTLIDISAFDSKIQKLAMSVIFDEAANSDLYLYNIVKFDNDNADKKLIKKFLANEKIYTTILCPHNFKYIHELKELSQNYIMFAPLSVQHDFAAYNVYLNKLNSDECIVYGKATQNIPLIVEVMTLDDLDSYIESASGNVSDEQKQDAEPEENKDFTKDEDIYEQDTMIEDDAVPDDISVEGQQEPQISEGTKSETSESAEEDNSESPVSEIDDASEVSTEDVIEDMPAEQEQLTDLSELETEFPSDETEQVDDYKDLEAELPSDEPVAELSADTSLLDDVITEEFPQEDIIEQFPQGQAEDVQPLEELTLTEPFEEPVAPVQDNLTEDDLNFIDNLQQEQQVTESEVESVSEVPSQDNFEQPLPLLDDIDEFSNSATDVNSDYSDEQIDEVQTENMLDEEQSNVVPIYPANEDTPVNGISSPYEQGDRVRHPKYGEGVVEKMVKFGDKVLCSINFANGRRLLDPTISQIEKL